MDVFLDDVDTVTGLRFVGWGDEIYGLLKACDEGGNVFMSMLGDLRTNISTLRYNIQNGYSGNMGVSKTIYSRGNEDLKQYLGM